MLLLLFIFFLSPSFAKATEGKPTHGQQQMAVRLGAVDSLTLPTEMTLERLVGRLEKQLAGLDRPLLIERRWTLIENYYRYKDGRLELALLDSVRVNLKRIYLLDQQLTRRGEISDTQLLTSHNAYLRVELEYLTAERTCREALFAILRLANIDIIMEPSDQPHGRIQAEKADPVADR